MAEAVEDESRQVVEKWECEDWIAWWIERLPVGGRSKVRIRPGTGVVNHLKIG